MNPACPRCGTPVRVLNVTDVGCSYRCPVHGVCSMRHDSMSYEDVQRLQLYICPLCYTRYTGAECPRCGGAG